MIDKTTYKRAAEVSKTDPAKAYAMLEKTAGGMSSMSDTLQNFMDSVFSSFAHRDVFGRATDALVQYTARGIVGSCALQDHRNWALQCSLVNGVIYMTFQQHGYEDYTRKYRVTDQAGKIGFDFAADVIANSVLTNEDGEELVV